MVFFKGGCRSSRGSVDWVARGCGFGSACGNYVAAISPDFGKLGKGLGTKMRAISLVTQTIVWGRMSARGLVFLLGGGRVGSRMGRLGCWGWRLWGGRVANIWLRLSPTSGMGPGCGGKSDNHCLKGDHQTFPKLCCVRVAGRLEHGFFFVGVCVCVGWLEDSPIGLLGVAGLGRACCNL